MNSMPSNLSCRSRQDRNRTESHTAAARWASVAQCCLALFALALLPAPAHANTYLFSVQGTDILNAIANTGSDPNTTSDAYFSIFLQPALSNFTFTSETGPNPTAPTDPWTATTIVDYADLGNSSPFAQFSKGQNQTQVAVLSNAYGTCSSNCTQSQNIFYNTTYSDTYKWPIGWGTVTGSVKDILPQTDTFQFTITTSQALSGMVTVNGVAEAIHSQSSLSDSQPKTEGDITFSLSVTPLASTPEPDTVILLAAGAFFLLIGRKSLKRNSR